MSYAIRFFFGVIYTGLMIAASGVALGAPVIDQGTWFTTLQGRDLDGDAATFEAYYDATLDITWLANANAAGSNMTWANATAWVTALDVNGITGWRLPTVTPINGTSFDTTVSADGSTDLGTAATTSDGTDGGWRDASGSPVSELGHLFYVTLGNLGGCVPSLPWCTPQAGAGLTNTGPFSNVFAETYWTGSVLDSTNVWDFGFSTGFQSANPKTLTGRVWAVRSGDISAVPIPAAAWLFGSGLVGGLLVLARRRG